MLNGKKFNNGVDMKILALQEKSNCGKTTVITKLYQKLCAKYKKIAYFVENQDGDFSAILDIKKHIIGLTSIGDSKKDLIHPFEIFDNYNCELVVVCCHKKRGKDMSKEFIEEKSHYYKTAIIWYTKANLQQCNTKYNAGAEIDEINDIQAKVLLEEILLQI